MNSRDSVNAWGERLQLGGGLQGAELDRLEGDEEYLETHTHKEGAVHHEIPLVNNSLNIHFSIHPSRSLALHNICICICIYPHTLIFLSIRAGQKAETNAVRKYTCPF